MEEITDSEWTVMQLERVLEDTRSQVNGITLDLVARTIRKVYDGAEVAALIERLQVYQD